MMKDDPLSTTFPKVMFGSSLLGYLIVSKPLKAEVSFAVPTFVVIRGLTLFPAEFMLVFDDGSFSEDNTFGIAELMAHNPLSVISKDLGVPVSAFKDIPAGELFIFPGTAAPKDINKQNLTSSAGILPKAMAYSYHWSQQTPLEVAGGSVKVVDPETFPIASNFAAALVTVKPGAMREIHWHPLSDEWTFFISGKGRATLFTPPSSAQTVSTKFLL
jgi:oxalate decarboxylase family bicupin protein